MIACDSAEPDDDHIGDEELITRISITLVSSNGISQTANAKDPDGDGVDFEIDTITLSSGMTYTGSVELADEINNEDVTEEIRGEGDHHQFFYVVGGDATSQVTIQITDEDEDGLPLGLSVTVTVADGGASTGTLRMLLSHYDDVVKTGSNRSDETDVDVTFPLVIN